MAVPIDLQTILVITFFGAAIGLVGSILAAKLVGDAVARWVASHDPHPPAHRYGLDWSETEPLLARYEPFRRRYITLRGSRSESVTLARWLVGLRVAIGVLFMALIVSGYAIAVWA